MQRSRARWLSGAPASHPDRSHGYPPEPGIPQLPRNHSRPRALDAKTPSHFSAVVDLRRCRVGGPKLRESAGGWRRRVSRPKESKYRSRSGILCGVGTGGPYGASNRSMGRLRLVGTAILLCAFAAACSGSSSTKATPTTKALPSTGTVARSGRGPITVTLDAIGGRRHGPDPLPGRVLLRNGSHVFSRAVGASGMVQLSVPYGTYTVTGHSPLYGSNRYLCTAGTPVSVKPLGDPPNPAKVSVHCRER